MRRFSLIILFAILFSLVMASCQSKNYEEKLESLYNHSVPLISSDDLAIKIDTGEALKILDIRSEEEFKVSHIVGALMIDYDNFEKTDVGNLAADSEIIVYCSVGYRSEKIGEKLMKLGYTNVKNLYGGIFQWKNDGFQVVNQQSVVTDSVHTYNRNWSQWLLKGVRVY